jgi:hypothetical protein
MEFLCIISRVDAWMDRSVEGAVECKNHSNRPSCRAWRARRRREQAEDEYNTSCGNKPQGTCVIHSSRPRLLPAVQYPHVEAWRCIVMPRRMRK